MKKNRVVSALATVAVLAVPTTAGADVGGPDIVSFVNAQRAANGIPAGITADPVLSIGCAKHNAYGRINNVLIHDEDPAKPGYSPEGKQAAQSSVLYQGGSWTSTSNPFEAAPIHLHQLLAPRISKMGASEDGGYGCATTQGAVQARPAPPADVTYTYPGSGATGWTPAQTAFEGPYTPGERVGIPAGTKTGPYLYVMFDGADFFGGGTATATSASLTDPAGPIDIAVIDNHTSGLEGYLPTGMELIPKAPLKPSTTYTASVAANVTTHGGGGAPARAFSHTWSFTTSGLPNSLTIAASSSSGRTVKLTVATEAPNGSVTATGPGATQTKPLGADGRAELTLPVDGEWNLCARSGGTGTEYLAAEQCMKLSVLGSVTRGTGGDGTPGTADFPFSFSVPATVKRGRSFKLTIESASSFAVRYTLKSRRKTLVNYRKTTFKAGSNKTFKLKVPSRYSGKGKKVKLAMVVTAGGKSYAVKRMITFR
jgi:hypothetical protein